MYWIEQERGPDLTIELDVTLKDLYVGRELIVTHQKQILCPECRGTGAKNPDDVQTCPVCKGTGVRVQTQRLGPGFVTQTQTTWVSITLIQINKIAKFNW